MEESAFWRRLDNPGCDACRVSRLPSGGWRVEGTAVCFDGLPSALVYVVVCDERWITRSASIRGWRGGEDVTAEVGRSDDGVWTLDGVRVDGLGDCLDVDLGFTPATNLIALRRLALAIGTAVDAPAAWFDVSTGRLERLKQHYERRSEHEYWYESPRFGYAALLDVTDAGLIRSYPGLWVMES